MTKAELIKLLENYSDDAVIEVVQFGAHYDVECVEYYNDCGIQIAELGIFDMKTIPESKKVKHVD